LKTLAKTREQKLNYKTSIADLLELLNLDGSREYRKLLAKELDVHNGSTGEYEHNIALYEAMIEQLCKNGGEVPERIRKLQATSG